MWIFLNKPHMQDERVKKETDTAMNDTLRS